MLTLVLGVGVFSLLPSSVREPSNDSRESGDSRESANRFARIGPSKFLSAPHVPPLNRVHAMRGRTATQRSEIRVLRRFWEGFWGRGSQKGSEKGVFYGFYSKTGF